MTSSDGSGAAVVFTVFSFFFFVFFVPLIDRASVAFSFSINGSETQRARAFQSCVTAARAALVVFSHLRRERKKVVAPRAFCKEKHFIRLPFEDLSAPTAIFSRFL